MSFPLLFWTPPMKHSPPRNASELQLKNADGVLDYIRNPEASHWGYFFAEIVLPFFLLSFERIVIQSIPVPTTLFCSIVLLNTAMTLSTSPRALSCLSSISTNQNEKNTFLKQKSLQVLLQWFVVLMGGLALVSTSPSPFLHLLIPLFTIICIAWPFLLYIDPDHSVVEKYLFHKKFNYRLWACSLIGVFGSTLGSLIEATPWTPYLQLAAYTSFTLLCKDTSTEMTESKQVARIKRLAHTILCLGVLAYHIYTVFIDPTNVNIASALLLSTHILFVLFIDAKQEINDNNHALKVLKMQQTLHLSTERSAPENVFHDLEKNIRPTHAAPWYFPMRALHYYLLWNSIVRAPLPIHPVDMLLRTFFLAQALANMTDCILKQSAVYARKRYLDVLVLILSGNRIFQKRCSEEVKKVEKCVAERLRPKRIN